MILVTAANGNQGRLLCPKLVQAGLRIRALVRSESSANELRARGIEDVVVGDMGDPGVLAAAIKGIDKVFHVGPSAHPLEREMGFAAIEEALNAGVRHFVFSSVLHAIAADLLQHRAKRDIEEKLISSGLEYTILQPSNFMSPIKLRPPFQEGVFRLAWSLDRVQTMVDLDDVTDVAVMVLTNSENHLGATYELVAPGRYTAKNIADVIAEVLGKAITIELISSGDFLKQVLGEGGSARFPYEASVYRAISDYYSQHDFVGNPNVLRWLLGREPTDYKAFVRKTYARFKSEGLSFSTSR